MKWNVISSADHLNGQIEKLKLVDTFRHLNPDKKDTYTYWSYRGGARPKNKGWRIDYFLISDKIKKNLKTSEIHHKQTGSDHAPIELAMSF